jgi:hypothetical protein
MKRIRVGRIKLLNANIETIEKYMRNKEPVGKDDYYDFMKTLEPNAISVSSWHYQYFNVPAEIRFACAKEIRDFQSGMYGNRPLQWAVEAELVGITPKLPRIKLGERKWMATQNGKRNADVALNKGSLYTWLEEAIWNKHFEPYNLGMFQYYSKSTYFFNKITDDENSN